MPAISTVDTPQREARRCRWVWYGWMTILLITAFSYAGRAAEERSAFLRWRHQVHELWDGKNIWETYVFPNPPILPMTLSPLMALPPLVGALSWFTLKGIMAALAAIEVFRMARGPQERAWPWWGLLLALGFWLRPTLSDLQHGNINLMILALIVAALAAWRRGLDVLAGLILALAISFKVTPTLFLPYFAYKRSFRTLYSTLLGLVLFLAVVPSLWLGTEFNGQCLASWWHRFIGPYVVGEEMNDQEVNQSLIGVLTRLLTDPDPGSNERLLHRNIASWSTWTVSRLAKVVSLSFAALMLGCCKRFDARRDAPRLLGEFALVLLTMLIISERSWKHHYVTILIPCAFLVNRIVHQRSGRSWRLAVLGVSSALMATTSSELGGNFLDGMGHKVALYYGMFLWSGVLLFVVTAIELKWEDREWSSMAALRRSHLDRAGPGRPPRRDHTEVPAA